MFRRIAGKSISPSQLRNYASNQTRPPIISIKGATFYRHHPNSTLGAESTNPPLFPNLNLEIASFSRKEEHWAIIGPSSAGKTTLLQILGGKHLCIRTYGGQSIACSKRSYPYLDEVHELPEQAIKYVGFDGEQGFGAQAPQSAYLSARYESRRENTDFSVLDYLQGNTELNPLQDIGRHKIRQATLERVIADLRLGDLINMPVSNLSNGQTRRARIAKAILAEPKLLLLDEPFMGLDPPTLLTLSPMLHQLAKANAPRLVLSLRPQDPIPYWVTHLMYLKGNCQVAHQGRKRRILKALGDHAFPDRESPSQDLELFSDILMTVGNVLAKDGIIERPEDIMEGKHQRKAADQKTKLSPENCFSRDGFVLDDVEQRHLGEVLVEMEGVRVQYGSKAVLGNWKAPVPTASDPEHPKEGLWWKVRRGERWGIFGPNGSGKTTLLSLICSDHPQTYSLPIKLFGHPRIPESGQKGISIFEIQSRIGHSSPEIHRHIPKSLTLRQVLENAWSDTFRGVPKLDEDAHERIDACLRWFEHDLNHGSQTKHEQSSNIEQNLTWADDLLFGGLPFSAQRIALFLRAIIKHPDLVILDEAFSGMDDEVRDRCLLFLAHGEHIKKVQLTTPSKAKPGIEESELSKAGKVKMGGLKEEQALLCISHVREEIPGSIREWICLPEANTGEPARFGTFDGPIEGNYRRWNEIWGM